MALTQWCWQGLWLHSLLSAENNITNKILTNKCVYRMASCLMTKMYIALPLHCIKLCYCHSSTKNKLTIWQMWLSDFLCCRIEVANMPKSNFQQWAIINTCLFNLILSVLPSYACTLFVFASMANRAWNQHPCWAMALTFTPISAGNLFKSLFAETLKTT